MTKSLRKKMILVIICIFLLLILLALLVNILTQCSTEEGSQSDTTDYKVNLEFSDEYITDKAEFLSDERYRALYESDLIHYYDQNGGTIGVKLGQYEGLEKPTRLLCTILETIISGDADTYNTFFSEKYFEENEPKSKFSMQKLYDILITPYSEEKLKDVNGGEYTEYIYKLEYKIRRNNGSFRSDVDSDGVLPQYFLITDREGTLLVDGIYTYNDFR